MIRVLLADDHPVVRTGYRRLLEQAGDIAVVADAGDGDEAYAAFVASRPDVLVADLTMGKCDGLELLRRVLRRDPQARVLVFTMHDGALLVRRALEAGARGFLTKASPPDCLVLAVRALHEGRQYLSPDVQLPANGAAENEAEVLATLSAREFEVFRLIAMGHTPAETADTLKLSAKTVANHQTAIREKLGASTSAAFAHIALRHHVIDSAEA